MEEVCDICATPESGTKLSADDLRRATKSGFDPAGMRLLPSMPGSGDLSRARRMWQMLVEQNDTDWNLCAQCMKAVSPYLGASTGAGPGTGQSKGGCFIATAACGSPYACEVELLREYRDTMLQPSRLGRAFVRWYERTSPPAARWIAARPRARGLVRQLFIRPVAALISAILRMDKPDKTTDR